MWSQYVHDQILQPCKYFFILNADYTYTTTKFSFNEIKLIWYELETVHLDVKTLFNDVVLKL